MRWVAVVVLLVGCRDLLGVEEPSVRPPDASRPMDAPELTGLGQKCVLAMNGADCPVTATSCASFTIGATIGMCTKLCIANGTFMTDAAGAAGALDPDPITQDGTCAAIYASPIGAGVCDGLADLQPPVTNGTLQPNTLYTFSMACVVRCGANNSCPSGYLCDADTLWCRPP